MHKGIDMAGTWQEEVRASADGQVIFQEGMVLLERLLKLNTDME